MISTARQDKYKNLYVITGGPGVGKTTLLQALSEAGFDTVAEDARRIIQQQVAINGNALPWKDKILYANLMLEASLDTYSKAAASQSEQPVFFDRGIVDTLCYMEMQRMLLPDHLDTIIGQHRYNPKVFILPPWREIYETDTERKQSWQEAEFTFHQMKLTYQKYGYELIQVPKKNAEVRAQLILDHICYRVP